MEKALLHILIKNLNIILNEYFHQFKSLKKFEIFYALFHLDNLTKKYLIHR